MAYAPGDTANRLVSIGYEGRCADELITMLLAERVRTVVDVRLTPISRKPGLSKSKLAAALADAGIGYVHLKELGNPRDNRAPFRAGTAAGRNRFAEVLGSADAERALDTVRQLIHDGTVALLCFERDHSTCHRDMIVDALRASQNRISVHHI
ncbi:DUF488 domain-containing protein [Nocardia sp. CA-119907]|uniref:DUF488 domain-containing protein n=1 Tax=Nocardia sp. CA-119907 TaxID=3239973 RepID=UPI003D9517F5